MVTIDKAMMDPMWSPGKIKSCISSVLTDHILAVDDTWNFFFTLVPLILSCSIKLSFSIYQDLMISMNKIQVYCLILDLQLTINNPSLTWIRSHPEQNDGATLEKYLYLHKFYRLWAMELDTCTPVKHSYIYIPITQENDHPKLMISAFLSVFFCFACRCMKYVANKIENIKKKN